MPGPSKEVMMQLANAAQSITATAFLVGLGAWGGMWLDGKCHTSPAFAFGLALIGMCLGLGYMVMQALASEKK